MKPETKNKNKTLNLIHKSVIDLLKEREKLKRHSLEDCKKGNHLYFSWLKDQFGRSGSTYFYCACCGKPDWSREMYCDHD